VINGTVTSVGIARIGIRNIRIFFLGTVPIRVIYKKNPWSIVCLEKLIFLQLLKKFVSFYGMLQLITVFAVA